MHSKVTHLSSEFADDSWTAEFQMTININIFSIKHIKEQTVSPNADNCTVGLLHVQWNIYLGILNILVKRVQTKQN